MKFKNTKSFKKLNLKNWLFQYWELFRIGDKYKFPFDPAEDKQEGYDLLKLFYVIQLRDKL